MLRLQLAALPITVWRVSQGVSVVCCQLDLSRAAGALGKCEVQDPSICMRPFTDVDSAKGGNDSPADGCGLLPCCFCSQGFLRGCIRADGGLIAGRGGLSSMSDRTLGGVSPLSNISTTCSQGLRSAALLPGQSSTPCKGRGRDAEGMRQQEAVDSEAGRLPPGMTATAFGLHPEKCCSLGSKKLGPRQCAVRWGAIL